MVHEKVIKREDGSKINLCVDLYVGAGFQPNVRWNIRLQYCAPRKRKFQRLYYEDDYEYRRLSDEDRRVYVYTKQLEYVTPEEILEVKMELYAKLKPTL